MAPGATNSVSRMTGFAFEDEPDRAWLAELDKLAQHGAARTAASPSTAGVMKRRFTVLLFVVHGRIRLLAISLFYY